MTLLAPVLTQSLELAALFTERMLNTLGEGVAIAAFAWIVLRWFRQSTPSTRFAVWFATLVATAALPLVENFSAGNSAVATSSSSASAFHLSQHWAMVIFAGWAIIAIVGLARISLSFYHLKLLRRSCAHVDPSLLPLTVQENLNALRSLRNIALLTSKKISAPVAIGFFQPAIVLPAWALADLDAFELNSVVLHEIAHLRRYDDWTNLAEQIARAIFFFHPAVWLIGRGLSLEREMACDDFVLAGLSSPRAYAECLVSVAEKSFLHRGLALAFAAAGRVHQTTRRVARILSGDSSNKAGSWKPALILVTAFSATSFLALPRVPKLITFSADHSVQEAALPVRPASSTPLISAHSIPASFHDGPPTSSAKVDAARKKVAPQAVRPSRSLLAHAGEGSGYEKLTANRTSSALSPVPVSSSIRLGETRATAQPHSVLVVWQSSQIDAYGETIYSLQFWRLTVYHPALLPMPGLQPHHVLQQPIPKST